MAPKTNRSIAQAKAKRSAKPRPVVRANISLPADKLASYQAAAARAAGGLTFSAFVRIAIEEKIAKDGLT